MLLHRFSRRPLLLALLVGLGFTLLLQGLSPTTEVPDRLWFDGLVQLREAVVSHTKPHPFLVLVAYDDQARKNHRGAPVPIRELVQALNKLHQVGSGPVVLDFLFGSLLDANELEDLIQAVTNHGMVFLPKVSLPRGGGSLRPPPSLALAARGVFEASIPMDADGRWRRWPKGDESVTQVLDTWTWMTTLAAPTPRQTVSQEKELVDPVFLSRPRWTTIRWEDLGTQAAMKDCVVVLADLSVASKDLVNTPWGPVWGAELILWRLQAALSDAPRLGQAPPLVAWGFSMLFWLLWMGSSILHPRTVRADGMVWIAWTLLAAGFGILGGLILPWGVWAWPGLAILGSRTILLAWHRRRRRQLNLVRDQRARALAAQGSTMGGLFHEILGRAGVGVHLARRGTNEQQQVVAILEGLRDRARHGLELMKPADPGRIGTDVPGLVVRLIDQLRLDRPASHITVSGLEELAALPLDELEAELAIMVFLTNALEASPTVKIQGSRGSRGQNRFVIEDRGPGLPLWFGRPRLRAGVTTKPGGHGFGLTWAMEMLEEAEIRVKFDSGRWGTQIGMEWLS